MQKILVVCIGNICRSPMAEGLLRAALPGKSIQSAGLQALIGKPADPLASKIMAEHAMNISAHRAQSLSTALVDAADLVLTMDTEQKRMVETRYVQARGKVFRLGDAIGVDIADPYRKDEMAFRRAFALIEAGVKDIAAKISRIS